jgi:hypothetical protein
LVHALPTPLSCPLVLRYLSALARTLCSRTRLAWACASWVVSRRQARPRGLFTLPVLELFVSGPIIVALPSNISAKLLVVLLLIVRGCPLLTMALTVARALLAMLNTWLCPKCHPTFGLEPSLGLKLLIASSVERITERCANFLCASPRL